MQIIQKAVILCAGKGTRFYPITSVLPKEMLPLYNKPVLHYIVLEIIKSGITNICFVINKQKQSIIDYFANKENINKTIQILKKQNNHTDADELQFILDKGKFSFVYQENPTGSGSAVECTKSFVMDESFLLSCGDDIILGNSSEQLMRAFQVFNATIIGTKCIDTPDIVKYGVIDIDKTYSFDRLQLDNQLISSGDIAKCKGIIEKPSLDKAPSNIVSVGKYILTPTIWDALQNINCSANGEYLLTDALQILCEDRVFSCNLSGNRYDIGDAQSMIKAIVDLLHTN